MKRERTGDRQADREGERERERERGRGRGGREREGERERERERDADRQIRKTGTKYNDKLFISTILCHHQLKKCICISKHDGY